MLMPTPDLRKVAAVSAERGRILDRKGRMLAGDLPSPFSMLTQVKL